MQWSARLIAVAQDCHKRGKQVTCKRARQTREEKTKREGGCMLTRLVYIQLIHTFGGWRNWPRRLQKRLQSLPSFFFFSLARLPCLLARLLARITLAHAIILTPLLVKKLASLQTIHHSAKIVIVSPKQTICIPLWLAVSSPRLFPCLE